MAQRADELTTAELLEQLGDIAHRLSSAQDLDETLQLIVDLGEDYLEGCDGVSLMLIEPGRTITSPAYSSKVAYDSDQAQYLTDQGPCLDALRERQTVIIDDLETETRWSDYRELALELGVRSMISFRLFAHEDTMGALDFYSATAHAFDAYSQTLGQVFASHAGVALKAAITEAGLAQAIRTRDVIGQAKGILMERQGVRGDAAFAQLRKLSQQHHRRLRDIAGDIVTTGEIPISG
ncbi:GAF and ANTAR domain-containing protein [soil metagenome]